ncbi:MAG: cell wall hydrolase [Bacillota bacterium]
MVVVEKGIKYFLSIVLLILIISNMVGNIQASDFKLIYIVQEGDSLSKIAESYDISLSELASWNNISSTSVIKVGDELVIPQLDNNRVKRDFNKKVLERDYSFSLSNSHTYAVRVNSSPANSEIEDINPEDLVKYTVSSGDTYYDIARKFNTSMGVIMALNEKDNSTLKPGEVLKVPAKNFTEKQLLARSISDYELELLAKAINGEARGEPYLGQVGVGAVIINRVLSPRFPDSIKKVIMQPGQFCVVEDGQIQLTPSRSTKQAAREAVNGRDPTGGALYFYNPSTSKEIEWISRRKPLVTIGNHVFAN